MCVIIAKDAGVDALDKEYFSRAWDANPHGGGVVWKEPDGLVMIQKGFMDKQEFMDRLDEINKKDNSFIAHFRIKSVGEIKAENCHPFVMDYVTFAHNGTLSIEPLKDKTDSETFGLAFLKDKPMSWIKEYQTLLEMALGTSKFAIMDNDTGEIFILNKDRGKMRDNVWFSNESAFESEPTIYKGYKGYDTDWWERTNTTYIADKTFGTKKYQSQWQQWDKDKNNWVYKSTGISVTNYRWNDTIVQNRKGLYELAPKFVPGKDLPAHKYTAKDPIHKVVAQAKAEINKELAHYYKQTFNSWNDRTDQEEMISAMHCVIDAVERLIAENKEVSGETLYDFIEYNIKSNRRDKFEGFETYVSWQCDAFMEDYKQALKQVK